LRFKDARIELAAGERHEDPCSAASRRLTLAQAAEPHRTTSSRFARSATTRTSTLGSARIKRERRDPRTISVTRLLRRSEDEVRRAAVTGDLSQGLDQIVGLLLQEVHAEDDREPAKRRQCDAFVIVQLLRGSGPSPTRLLPHPMTMALMKQMSRRPGG
jgi:hypothetical protein